MAELVSVAILGYLLGSIPVGFLMGKLRGIDVRRYGSGATGGTNVLRTLGPWAALFTVLCDIGKGLLAAYLGQRLAGEWGFVAAGLLASLGHSYPVWLRFRGGKSVATSGGVMLLHYPLAVLVGIAAGALAVVPTRWVSLGSLTATPCGGPTAFLLEPAAVAPAAGGGPRRRDLRPPLGEHEAHRGRNGEPSRREGAPVA